MLIVIINIIIFRTKTQKLREGESKHKFVSVHDMKSCGEVEVHLHAGTHCIGGWVGSRVGLDRCGIPRSHRNSIPGPSNP